MAYAKAPYSVFYPKFPQCIAAGHPSVYSISNPSWVEQLQKKSDALDKSNTWDGAIMRWGKV